MATIDDSPFIALNQRMQMLGRILALLCWVWGLVVGGLLLNELTADDMEHHRAPIVKERINRCEGAFSERFHCTEAVLLKGEKSGTLVMLARLATVLILPGTAWLVWTVVTTRIANLLWPKQMSRHWPHSQAGRRSPPRLPE